MTEQPFDPGSESIEQSKRNDSSMAGQQGYGVQFEDGRYQNSGMQSTPEGGRSGSYEDQNAGGYGKQGESDQAGEVTTSRGETDDRQPNSPQQRNRHLDQGQGV